MGACCLRVMKRRMRERCVGEGWLRMKHGLETLREWALSDFGLDTAELRRIPAFTTVLFDSRGPDRRGRLVILVGYPGRSHDIT